MTFPEMLVQYQLAGPDTFALVGGLEIYFPALPQVIILR
jgi:hypothetical protein